VRRLEKEIEDAKFEKEESDVLERDHLLQKEK